MTETISYLKQHFMTKNKKYMYFLILKFHLKKQIASFLEKLCIGSIDLGCKPIGTPIVADVNFWSEDSRVYDNVKQYRRMVGKLVCLTVTRPELFFVVGLLCQFIHKSWEIHWRATLRIITYIKSFQGKGLLSKKLDRIHISVCSDVAYTCR